MKPRIPPQPDPAAPHRMPGWIRAARPETPEDAGFLSGAALAHLCLAGQDAAVPQALWRDRLALQAAVACAGFSGRRDTAAQLRDALHLTRPGDDPGPAGRCLRQWARAVAGPVSVAGLGRALEGVSAGQIALCLETGGPPIPRAAAVLEAVLAADPRAETAALILADAALARALGLGHMLPCLALALTPRALRLGGAALRMACQRAVVQASLQAVPLADDLARAAARLRAVAPMLRARGAAQAVDLFLSRDAVAPPALAFMSDRAARRLCDRLTDLGALRELTGRDAFRLYGV